MSLTGTCTAVPRKQPHLHKTMKTRSEQEIVMLDIFQMFLCVSHSPIWQWHIVPWHDCPPHPPTTFILKATLVPTQKTKEQILTLTSHIVVVVHLATCRCHFLCSSFNSALIGQRKTPNLFKLSVCLPQLLPARTPECPHYSIRCGAKASPDEQ